MRRPIIETGTATKYVYLSQAPQKLTPDEANDAIRRHIGLMVAELGKENKLVTSITKTVVGWGDVRVQAKWVVLGEKETKKARRAKAGSQKASAGLAPVQTGDQTGPLLP